MKKDWTLYAYHIVDRIEKIKLIEARGDITEDHVLYDAVLRNLQTLSEATQHLPEIKTKLYPHIPWRDIHGFRNILVHNYLGDIDAVSVSNVIRVHLAPLEKAVKEMLLESKSDF